MESRNSALPIQNDTPDRLAVAVIGAGLSGLTAARTLADHGLAVRLFERARGPGGRLATRRTGDYAFDHGAQYFTVRDERFRRSVDAWMEDGLVQRWEGKIGVAGDGTVMPKESETTRYVGAPRMSALTRHLADALDVVYGTRVASMRRADAQWHLFDSDGGELGTFDVALVAMPPPQAAPLLTEAPTLVRQVGAVTMQPCWAVMALFDAPLPLAYDGLFVHNAPLSWAARNSSKPGRPTSESWVLHGAPEWSRRHLEADPDAISEQLLNAFFDATGLDPVAPRFVQAHRWRYSLASEPLDSGCLWDAGLRLGVCGDWCSNSRVEGAFLSGLALSRHVLELSGQHAAPPAKGSAGVSE